VTRSKIWLISIIFILIDALMVGACFFLTTYLRKIIALPFGLASVTFNTVFSMAQLGILFVLGVFFFSETLSRLRIDCRKRIGNNE